MWVPGPHQASPRSSLLAGHNNTNNMFLHQMQCTSSAFFIISGVFLAATRAVTTPCYDPSGCSYATPCYGPECGFHLPRGRPRVPGGRDLLLRPYSWDFRKTDYVWYDAVGMRLPCGSPVLAGWTAEGRDIYVGRAWHKGHLLPASVIPPHGGAYVGLNWDEFLKPKYMVLCDGNPTWLSARDGRVPRRAKPIGHSAQGEDLYYGRVQMGEALLPGKIVPSHKGIFVPFEGKEHYYQQYEVMVLD